MAARSTAPRDALTQARLKQAYHYDPETGLFTRLEAPMASRAGLIGMVLGSGKKPNSHRSGTRIAARIDGYNYQAHRLAWLYVHGKWPPDQIDHINGNPADNRIDNLRPANNSQNHANLGPTRLNRSGLKGVKKHRHRWVARITVGGREKHLGSFQTPQAASAAYIKAARLYFGEYARLRYK